MLISLNNGEIIIDNNFIDGFINRNGKQYFIKGEIFDFNDEGELTFNNGDKCIGNFFNDSRNGKGAFYFGKGGVYEGNF